MSDNWIGSAIKHPGALTRKANAAGKSVGEYAQEEKHAPGITGRQARLAMTLRKFADGGVISTRLPYQTPLTAQQEAEFQNYAKLRPGLAFDPLPHSDYDERGQWLAQKRGLDPGGNWASPGSSLLEQKSDGPHGSDVWKTPYHRTFSNESKYAISGREPRWTPDGKLVSPTGSVLADESQEGRNHSLMGLQGMRKFADGGVVQPAKDDPIDAQIEARRLLARQGYRGVSPAGLPPSFASQPLVGSDITVDVGGHKFSVPADKSYDVAPEQWKPSDASAMGIRPGVLAQLIDKARMAAEESSYIPSSYRRQTPKQYADGGVVAPQQPQQQMPAWQRIWQALMGREALRRASGEQPQAPPPQNTDYSIVRKAAEEAGKRNDEEQRLKNAQPKPFCEGGMVRPYR